MQAKLATHKSLTSQLPVRKQNAIRFTAGYQSLQGTLIVFHPTKECCCCSKEDNQTIRHVELKPWMITQG